MKLCPKCNTSHSKPGTFCSRVCANSRGPRSDETKIKQSIANKNYLAGLSAEEKFNKNYNLYSSSPNNFASGPYTKIRLRPCSYCKKVFWSNNANTVGYNTTCSDHCFLAVKRKNASGNKTEYNGELYDSNWEVIFAKWLHELNITFIRPQDHIPWTDSNGNKRKYFPDFYIPQLNLYVDPKNKFCIIDQKEKLDYVCNNINLIYGELSYIKEYITNILNTSGA